MEPQMKFCKDCKHILRVGQGVIRPEGAYCTGKHVYVSKTNMVTGHKTLTTISPDVFCDFNRSEEGLCKQEGLLFEQKVVPPKTEPPPIRIENTTRDWGWLGRVICGKLKD